MRAGGIRGLAAGSGKLGLAAGIMASARHVRAGGFADEGMAGASCLMGGGRRLGACFVGGGPGKRGAQRRCFFKK